MNLTDLFSWLTDPGQRTFWLFWVSTLVLALLWAALDWQERRPRIGQWFSRAYWWNTSACQDYVLILLNGALFTLLGVATLVLILRVANVTYEGLNVGLPAAVWSAWHGPLSAVVYTLILVLLDDITRYGLHRALHSRWLWPVHRLHHSASVLTPLTFLRVHPLEKLMYQCRTALVHGGATGSYFFLFGQHSQPWLIFGISGSVLLFNLFGANLRHSNIPLRYGRLEKWLISPAQHQVHHGVGTSRYNYGSAFAIWDRMFGSWRPGAEHIELPDQRIPLARQLFLRQF
ncbi:MAG: fatty acid hydroxylase [Thalassolituus sp.]|nr:MAG: fatty acid hydroxylase [Thalassolituus sp.]